MINLELLRIFKVVAEEENVTHASEILCISQPAVTKHIRNLEMMLNIKLFERTNKGLILTENGTNLYNDTKDIINNLLIVEKKYSTQKQINFAIRKTSFQNLFSTKLSKFYTIHNDIQINLIQSLTRDEMLSKLEKKDLDIVIMKKVSNFNKDILEFTELNKLHHIFIADKNNNMKNELLTLEKLKNCELFFMPNKMTATYVSFKESIDKPLSYFSNIKHLPYLSIVNMIKGTNAIALIPKEYIELNKDIVQIKDDLNIKPSEYGIYINKMNLFKELNELIKVLKM